MAKHVFEGRALVVGEAEGQALVFSEPLSFWGGMDPVSGQVIDRRHPHLGAQLQGQVLVMPSGRGSSSASSVLAEAIRAGTAPAAIVLREVDLIVALGAIVADEIYARRCPIVVLAASDYSVIATGDWLRISAGIVEISA